MQKIMQRATFRTFYLIEKGEDKVILMDSLNKQTKVITRLAYDRRYIEIDKEGDNE
jgi:hypothetical protein